MDQFRRYSELSTTDLQDKDTNEISPKSEAKKYINYAIVFTISMKFSMT